jgi:hypothetical protein
LPFFSLFISIAEFWRRLARNKHNASSFLEESSISHADNRPNAIFDETRMSLEGRAHETTCSRDMNRTGRIALKLSPKMNQPKANFNQEAALILALKYTCIPFVHSADSQAAERPIER